MIKLKCCYFVLSLLRYGWQKLYVGQKMIKTPLVKEFVKELAALSTLLSAAYVWLVIGTAVAG